MPQMARRTVCGKRSDHTYVHLLVSKSVVEEPSESLDERTDVTDVRTAEEAAAAFGGARILASAAAAATASSVTYNGRSGHSSCSSEWQSAQLRCDPADMPRVRRRLRLSPLAN
jgi:hypothetical protein